MLSLEMHFLSQEILNNPLEVLRQIAQLLQAPAHQYRYQACFQVAFHGSKIMITPGPNKEKDRRQQSRSTSNRWFEKKGVKAVKVTKESQTIILKTFVCCTILSIQPYLG